MAVAGMFAAGAWLYCVALVVSTRWFLGLFTSTNVSDTVDAATTTTTTTDAGKPPAAAVLGAGRKVGVKKDKEVAPASAPQTQTQLQRMEVKHEPVEEEWSEEKEERDGDDEKTLHGLSTDDEAPKKVGEVSERERMRRNIQKSLR
ncbi:hypothetical protein EX30DRAFT_344801 [Ascodesmis nigricans]|uniref:Uncharacterized protein n=1 Tax=Ascodesmis nigricans TaxID=341454 RepID=A0A4S2MII5_9PEZI|nr:hypothetical protein EX30DRAFT_344801 [Ascodesmis nigricans]